MASARPWRPAVLKLHRWMALGAGLILVLNACTGLLLLSGRPLDKALNPQLFVVSPGPATVSLESVRASLTKEAGNQTLVLQPPARPGDSLVAEVRGDNGWEGQIFIDPYTGRRLGTRGRFDVGVNGLFELHSALLSGSFGKGVLGLAAACMLAIFLSGIALWWPVRWRLAFKVNLESGRLRSLFDLHRVGGVVLGLWVLTCVTTGGLLAWRPASQWINDLSGRPAEQAPRFVPVKGAQMASLDSLVQQAQAALAGGRMSSIQLSPKPGQAVRIRKKLDDDPHPNGLTSIWLNPQTGTVLRIDRWNGLPPGSRMFAWLYPLHTGALGGGWGIVMAALGGCSLLGFGVTGSWMWWLRRRNRVRLQRRHGAQVNQASR